MVYRNHEGYKDPTAGIALDRVTKEEEDIRHGRRRPAPSLFGKRIAKKKPQVWSMEYFFPGFAKPETIVPANALPGSC